MMMDLKYGSEKIKEKTEKIYEQVLKKSESIDCPNFKSISTDDMRLLLSLYDREFFDEFFRKEENHDVHFRLSKRMTKSAGNTKFYKDPSIFSISLSTPILFQTFSDIDRTVNVNGVVCKDRLEATMRVFEHELIHVIEWIRFGNTNHDKQFKRLAMNIFGHTEITHQMVTQEERAAKLYGLKKGDLVTFEYSGKRHRGFINRITKRATVMAIDPEGNFQDEDGSRYSKYYIPLPQLTPLEK